jgi:sulfur-oxidizing protein SoxY
MERRQFLNLTLGALALAVVPASVRAEDFRKLKPNVWTAHTVNDAIKAMYGKTELIENGSVFLKASGEAYNSGKKAVASSGGAIPVVFSTEIPAKTIALFQDANPEAAVIVYTVTKYSVNNYEVKIKMGKPGTITVVVEGQDGKLYAAKQELDVALGGCEG